MDIEKIINVESMTLLLTFFLPGYLGLKTFEYLSVIKFDTVKINIFSVLLSYISILIEYALFGNIMNGSFIWMCLKTVILSMIIVFVMWLIFKSKGFKNFNNKILQKTHLNIWEHSSSYSNGQIFIVYTKDMYCYIGSMHMISYDNSKNIEWIALQNYEQLKVNNDETKISIVDFTTENNIIVNIRQEDIVKFEIVIN